MLVHLCPGAWEIVHKPKVRELSIVASPAYKDTAFQPVGFFAAMNEGQWDAILKTVTDSQLSVITKMWVLSVKGCKNLKTKSLQKR